MMAIGKNWRQVNESCHTGNRRRLIKNISAILLDDSCVVSYSAMHAAEFLTVCAKQRSHYDDCLEVKREYYLI